MLIRRIGHIRAVAFCTGIFAIPTLVHTLRVDPWAGFALVATLICVAALPVTPTRLVQATFPARRGLASHANRRERAHPTTFHPMLRTSPGAPGLMPETDPLPADKEAR